MAPGTAITGKRKNAKEFVCNYKYRAEAHVWGKLVQSVQFMSGGWKNFFNLEEYKKALGKDNQRITLVLCPVQDHMANQGLATEDCDLSDLASDEFFPPKKG